MEPRKVRVILSGRDITDELEEVVIQEGTKRSDVVILKLKYTDGRVDTKVLLPHPLHREYKIIFKET
jgi:hypothetical protein